MPDYTYIDQPFFLQYLFFPRADFSPCPVNAFDLTVNVSGNTKISCRFYTGGTMDWPWILFFHGNGEVVSDYDGLAGMYHQQHINLVVADYRGYGASSGTPTFTDLIRDAHCIYRQVREELAKRNCYRDLFVMGRSLGSIPALELAYHYQQDIGGLIIESGFVSVNRLILHLGMIENNEELDRIEQECLEMIQRIYVPALLLHGQWDNLVLPLEGFFVYETLGSLKKDIVIIDQAGHNDVIFLDIPTYFGALKKFVYRL